METYGWDTVYCIKIEKVNSALADNMGKIPQTMDYSTDIEGISAHLQCNFAPWSVISGGSGKLLHLKVPIQNGVLTINNNSKAITNVSVVVQVSLKLLPSALDPMKQELMFNLNELGVMGETKEGAVSPITLLDPDGCLSAAAKDIVLWIIPKYLVQNAYQISYVFAQINYVKPGSSSWLTPRQCTYAYVDGQGNGSLAILSATDNRDISNLPLIIDPNIISENANAGYIISKDLFLKNVILPMLPLMYPGTTPDKFYFNSSHCIVNNGSFATKSVVSGAVTYHPQINALNLTIDGAYLATSIHGFCDLYAGITMKFTIDTKNEGRYDPQSKRVLFYIDRNPASHHDEDIPWYLKWLSPIVYLIVSIIVPIISNSIFQTLQSQSQSFVTTPPDSIDWSGVKTAMDITNAGIDGSYFIQGKL